MRQSGADPRVGIVMITWNRRERVLETLERLTQLPERPAIVLVDNGSTDGTATAVANRFAGVQVIALEDNRGAVGRTIGVQAIQTPYVAFCDDDTWWEAGDLRQAADHLDAHSRLGLVMARVLVGGENRVDPVCTQIEVGPLSAEAGMPGPRLVGFLAGASMVRRSAFLDAGGFTDAIGLGGEEEWLAMELLCRGWQLCYDGALTVHHHPCPHQDTGRAWTLLRNALWFAWLRRPFLSAVRRTCSLVWAGPWNLDLARAFCGAAFGLPRLLPLRRVAPPHIERDLRLLECAPRAEDHGALRSRPERARSPLADIVSDI